MEILWDETGRPGCLLTGGAAARLQAIGGGAVFVSITHDGGGVAAAVAVIDSAPKDAGPRSGKPFG